ncbi:MAG: tetratricopeptide repeat protein [Deltaproteobacteria bacterium]|nr:tetratricopeptide repeat protein [Deltaproteobacteria bacterium]
MAKKKDQLKDVELPPELAQLAPPDPFLERAQEYAGYVEKHARSVALGVGGVIVLAIVGIVLQQQLKASRAEATVALTKAVKDYRDFLEKTETASTSATVRREAEKLVTKFQAFERDHAGSPSGELARLYEADLLRRSGKPGDAEKAFKSYLDAAKPKDPMLFLALEGAGYAAEETGNLDAALGYFKRLSMVEGEFYRDHGFFHVGRIEEVRGNTEAAIAAYKQIADNFPKSKLREKIDGRLAALK